MEASCGRRGRTTNGRECVCQSVRTSFSFRGRISPWTDPAAASERTLMADAQPTSDRKTPEDRGKMTELERIRHSCAHVLATAILRLWPGAQFAAGPPVENGFYYDVELDHRITPEDFPRLEEEM